MATRHFGSGAIFMVEELSYHRLRASQERTAALQSRNQRVRLIHIELAERYEERVRAMIAHSERPATLVGESRQAAGIGSEPLRIHLRALGSGSHCTLAVLRNRQEDRLLVKHFGPSWRS